ncbi:MAG: TfoX/Sxy family protein [Anaerolineales bacterium]|nr:TfoX/Sxy family protein [Anaerolineales bacterium]
MGEKGDLIINLSTMAAEEFQDKVGGLGPIRIKKMFGGYGVFEDDTMFALVDKNGIIFLKAYDSNRQLFEDAGSIKHGRMPYFKVPENILNNNEILLDWARSAISAAKKAK